MTFGKIGARKMMNTAWINPYVKDGLIAMWDGIWNVGGGQPHDSTSPVWWDCIGGYPILSPYTCNYFGDDCYITTLGGVNTIAEHPQGTCPGSTNTFGFVHMEVVLEIGPQSHATEPFALGIGSRGLWLNRSVNSVGLARASEEKSWIASLDFSTRNKFSVSASYASTSSGSSTACWLDGISATKTGSGDTWYGNVTASNGMVLGYTGSYNFYGSYYALRLYSRALTADEISANYAVDKERFSLP